MVAGIAKVIARDFPEALAADKKTKKGDKGKLGTYTAAYSLTLNKTIINLYGQYNYGNFQNHLDYGALAKALLTFHQNLLEQFGPHLGGIKVGTYLLGCFHAGGKPGIVSDILANIFLDMPIFVYHK
jgi:hypothetical protein